MSEVILIINLGSSSLKFRVYTLDLKQVLQGAINNIPEQAYFKIVNDKDELVEDSQFNQTISATIALNTVIDWLQKKFPQWFVIAAGHRVVHGGDSFRESVIVDEQVFDTLSILNSLAPLHQPHNLAGIKILQHRFPNSKQVASFDTAFHSAQNIMAKLYALPRHFYDEHIKHYGFHGLSYEYISTILPELLGKSAAGRIVIAHLGHGASLCAVHNLKSIYSTMGFTALDGLPMGTRCGRLDPGIILYMLDELKLSTAEITDILYHQSGLLGLSGISNDLQVLLKSTDTQAKEAVEFFVYRINQEIGSLVATLGGIDHLIFTGGIGEHAAQIREQVCHQAQWLGIKINPSANENNANCISTEHSKIGVWVIPTCEELIIARDTVKLLAAS